MISVYEEKIDSLTKDNIKEFIQFFHTSIFGSVSRVEGYYLIDKLIEKTIDLKKNEYIKNIIHSIELLKKLMSSIPKKADYLFHFYIVSLSLNGYYKEITLIDGQLKFNYHSSPYKERINYNIGRAYTKLTDYSNAEKYLLRNKSTYSQLFLSYIYYLDKNPKEMELYKKLNKENLEISELVSLYHGLARYYKERNQKKITIYYLKKLENLLLESRFSKSSTYFLEIADIYKALNSYGNYIFFLKRSAEAKSFDDANSWYKLIAIEKLNNLGLLQKPKILSLFKEISENIDSESINQKMNEICLQLK